MSKRKRSSGIGSDYMPWTGIGTVGATVIGILFYKESKSPLRMVCILGIIFTIVGLRLVG